MPSHLRHFYNEPLHRHRISGTYIMSHYIAMAFIISWISLPFLVDFFQTFDSTNHQLDLRILESLYIHQTKLTINLLYHYIYFNVLSFNLIMRTHCTSLRVSSFTIFDSDRLSSKLSTSLFPISKALTSFHVFSSYFVRVLDFLIRSVLFSLYEIN